MFIILTTTTTLQRDAYVDEAIRTLSVRRYECQVFDSYVRSSNYALLAIAELPNNELTSIHTLSLPPLLL